MYSKECATLTIPLQGDNVIATKNPT